MIDSASWKKFIQQFSDPHLLQTSEWGELKNAFGWRASHLISGENGAQILFKDLPLGLSLAYIPKGPLGSDWQVLMPEIDRLCKQNRAVFLKIEPDAWEDQSPDQDLATLGFRPSPHTIQPPRTITIDISGTEEEILARMKQKTRYNIRLAGKKEVIVKASNDIESFSKMMDVTGNRDAFGVHTQAYYQAAYDLFHPTGMCEILVAEYQGEPLAGLMVFAYGKRAWYLYGASANQHRNRMPTYLLQWEAIRWAKQTGSVLYDLWGVPDEDEHVLEKNFSERRDGLWGVYRFKRGFGGELKRSVGAYDKVYNPLLYFFYQLIISRRNLA